MSEAGLTASTATDSVLDDREIEARWGAHRCDPWCRCCRRCSPGATDEAAHLLAITDAQGIVLHKTGDREIVAATDEIAFVRGADWSERGAGTNAMGTAIALDHQVQIFSAEHFSVGVHPWHCCAAPVHDPATGEVVAVIDLTGRLRTAHPHTLGLVTAAAGVAETYLRRDLAVHDDHAKALYLARVTGAGERTALIRHTGEVVAAAPEGWLTGEIRTPCSARGPWCSPAARSESWRSCPGPTCWCCGATSTAASTTPRRRPARAWCSPGPTRRSAAPIARTRCRRVTRSCWRCWRWRGASCRPRS